MFDGWFSPAPVVAGRRCSCGPSVFGCSKASIKACRDADDEDTDAMGEERTMRVDDDAPVMGKSSTRPGSPSLPSSPSSRHWKDADRVRPQGSVRSAPGFEEQRTVTVGSDCDGSTGSADSSAVRLGEEDVVVNTSGDEAFDAARHHHSNHNLLPNDLRLSRALSRNLGLLGESMNESEATMESKESTSMQPPPQQAASFKILPMISRGLKSFRTKMMAEVAPTAQEIDRGVHIHSVYDFYAFDEKKVRLRKIDSEVFHHRASRIGEDEEEDLDEGMSVSSSTDSNDLPDDELGVEQDGAAEQAESRTSPRASSFSPRQSPRQASSRMRPSMTSPVARVAALREAERGATDASQDMPRLRLTRANTVSCPEVVSRWGVIAGKMMHSRVLDFTALSDKAVRRKRIQGSAKPKKGVIFESVRRRAQVVAKQAWMLAKRVAAEDKDRFDNEWQEQDLLVQIFSKDYVDTLALFANTATKILRVQPTLVTATAPCRIFGDIHGQFRDLLLLFRAFGSPDERGAPNFVFNGDFVDRGAHSLEVIGLLLALKVLLPEKVWLVRGNHEDRSMNQKYGFWDECNERLGPEFGPKLFELFHKAFDQLPLACLVSNRVLVLHGGIGDGAWQLRDVRGLKRPLGEEQLSAPEMYWASNMLWSDPMEDDDDREVGTFGVHESPRGGRGALFGWDVTKTFCARNGLGLIVRSHQSKQDSLGIDIMHENHLIRVFSARDYEGHGNDGAVLFIEWSKDDRAGNTQRLLTVRPQILSSATKARRTAASKAKHDLGDDRPLSPRGRRASVRRRNSHDATAAAVANAAAAAAAAAAAGAEA